MSRLFQPLKIRSIELKNRIVISPMCQYSSEDGCANDWHLVHLGSRAAGGAALVMVEATAVEARGRISPADMGIWDERHVEPLARVARFVSGQGAVPAIQLAHAGRKSGTRSPWDRGQPGQEWIDGWDVVAPSPIRFDELAPPRQLSVPEIKAIQKSFVEAAGRARRAGFEV